MAQRIVLPFQTVFIQRVGVPVLAIKTVACGNVMIFVWCPGKLDVSIPAGKSFNARRFTRSGGGGTLLLVFFAFRQATVGFHSQHAVDQRTAGKELTVISIATVAMFLNSGVNRDAAVPFLTNFW